jgi:hypothetical protein
MTDKLLPDLRVVKVVLKVSCFVIYGLRKINCVNVLTSTFMPIKRIAYTSLTDAKERNENMRVEKIT